MKIDTKLKIDNKVVICQSELSECVLDVAVTSLYRPQDITINFFGEKDEILENNFLFNGSLFHPHDFNRRGAEFVKWFGQKCDAKHTSWAFYFDILELNVCLIEEFNFCNCVIKGSLLNLQKFTY